MNPRVFREYDIRGVAARDLDDDFTRDLGRAIGTFLARRGQHRTRIPAARYHRRPNPTLVQGVHERQRAWEHLGPLDRERLVEHLVLPVAEAAYRLGCRGIGRLAFRQCDAA